MEKKSLFAAFVQNKFRTTSIVERNVSDIGSITIVACIKKVLMVKIFLINVTVYYVTLI